MSHVDDMRGDRMNRLMEVDALKETLDKIPARSIENADGRTYVLIRLSTVFEIIKQMPSAQPEIIRCRDCKHYYYADNRVPQEQMCVCDLDGDRWTPDSFCSFGERKSE